MNLRIPYAAYRDKVLAGWIGKSLGGVFLGAGDPEKKRGISYIHDCLEYLPPVVGNAPLAKPRAWL